VSPKSDAGKWGAEDYRNLLHRLQTEKPVFWDSEAGWLRTAHPQMHDAAPVGELEGNRTAMDRTHHGNAIEF
jgi:hypothetical protein